MITCSACGYDKNPNYAEFCDACGSELQAVVAAPLPHPPQVPTVIQPEIPAPQIPQSNPPSSNPIPISPANAATARLISKKAGSPTPEFIIDGNAIVGIFDPDMGPVDIDLEEFSGGETVSRNHAEIYQEGGDWKIKDIGSTNGTFIKPLGQTRFGARITIPQTINSGDEIAFGKVIFLFQSP